MNENKTLNILKRFTNKVKNNINSFNFSYLAYLIFEKTEDTLNSFISFFPETITNKISGKINYILNNLPYGKNNPNLFNETKLNLIKDIYKIFKNKKEEIEKNNNAINLLDIDSYNVIFNKIIELQKKFYSDDYNIRITTKTDSIGKLSQDIEKIIQDISKAEKEKDNNQNNTQNNSSSILADKFLIIDKENKKVDRKTKPIEKINLSEINNKSNAVDAIEIDEIIQPKEYSINSLMKYYGNCILKTQMIPAFIRYAVINKNEDDEQKATKILSELYNLYKIINEYNFSLISP
jgi:hypothetical protein